MELNFFTAITLLSVFLTTILSLFFYFTEKGVSIENKLLAILLFLFNLQIFYSFMTSNFTFQYFMQLHKAVFILKQTSFLFGPIIYFYVNSFLKRIDVINYRNLYHFSPFIAVVLFLLFYYKGESNFIIWKSGIDLPITILILLHNFIYFALSVVSMKSVEIKIHDLFKSIKISSHKTWLQLLLLGFIVIWIVNLNSFAIIMIVQKPDWCAYTASIYGLTAFLFVNALMFMLLFKPDIYYIVTKYKNVKIKADDKTQYVQKLNAHIEINKPYLNSEITLESLANDISVSPRVLSQIINETFKKTFKSYILEYRIKESMQLLSDSKYGKLTILEILYKVGFNSKSTFNNQFKLFTNLTPHEYRAKFMVEKKNELIYS